MSENLGHRDVLVGDAVVHAEPPTAEEYWSAQLQPDTYPASQCHRLRSWQGEYLVVMPTMYSPVEIVRYVNHVYPGQSGDLGFGSTARVVAKVPQ